MKKNAMKVVTCALSAAFATFSCIEFTSDFNRIEENKLRVIGVSYLPRPEAAPGDTVSARVYFAGNRVTGVEKFSCTFSSFGDRDQILFDEEPLMVIGTTSWLPDSFEYRFVLSDSVLIKHRSWRLDSLTSDSIARFMAQPVDSITARIATLSEAEQGVLLDKLGKLSLGIGTFCTARAENGSTLRVLSIFYIRYNSRYAEYLPVNNNPAISWIAAYAVPRAAAMGYNPFDTANVVGVHKTFLYNMQHPDSVDTTIVIDTGCSYFFACDNGVAVRAGSDGTIIADTVRDVADGNDGTPEREEYGCKWFFQNLDPVSEDTDSMLVIDDTASESFIEFRPPLTVRMQRFNLWVAEYDQIASMYGDRPRGMGVKGVSGTFEFTDAYRDSVAWK